MGRNFKRYQRTRDLPQGHTERKKAEDLIKEKYEKSHAQESKFVRGLPRRFKGLQDYKKIKKLIFALCFLTGTPPPKLIFNSDKIPRGCIACCYYKELHFYRGSTISTAIYELSHHIINKTY